MEGSDAMHEPKNVPSSRKRRLSATGITVRSAIQNGRVRPNESDNNDNDSGADEGPSAKQRQFDPDKIDSVIKDEFNLVDFCDEILFEIFKNLDTWTILALMNSSPRFVGLLLDRRFWYNIDLSNGPLPLGMLEDILVRSNDRTHTIKIRGPPSEQHVAGEFKQFTTTLTFIFPKLQNQLQVLELQGVSLDFGYIHIGDFPVSLKRLVLKDCSVKIPSEVKSIFHTIDTHLVVLEELGIEDCDWFEPYYIMAISKLPNLRSLSLKGCSMLSKFVPYGSMAARFGFHHLEVLDLRQTPINNADLQCFGAVETLRELLLDCPEMKRKEPEPGEDRGVPIEAPQFRVFCAPPNVSVDLTLRAAERLINARPQSQPNGEVKSRSSPLTKDARLNLGTAEAANKSLPKCDPANRVDTADDERPSTSAHAAALGRATERHTAPQIPLDTSDMDDMPSTSNGIRRTLSHGSEELKCSQNRPVTGNKRIAVVMPGMEVDSDTDTDNENDNDNDEIARIVKAVSEIDGDLSSQSNSPLGDINIVNGSAYSNDTDEDDRDDGNDGDSDDDDNGGNGDDDNDEDDDDDDDDDDDTKVKNAFEKINRKIEAGINIQRTVSSPTTTDNTSGTTSSTLSTNGNSSTSGTQSDETNSSSNANPDSDSNSTVLVLRISPNGTSGNLQPQQAEPLPQVSLPPPRAFILCPRQERLEHMLHRIEQMRANMRLMSQRRSSNNPASSRFLPRPYQIICMNPQNPREPIYMMHARRHQHLLQGQPPPPYAMPPQPPRAPSQFDQVMGHPMFWSMLDPLNRDQSGRRHRHRTAMPPITTQVTDRAMYSFGRAPNPVEPGVIWIRNVNRAQNNRLERIVLRNYTQITNLTLQHLVQCSPNLVYIDVSGTCVTPEGIANFQVQMPACEIVATHLSNDSERSEAESQAERENRVPDTHPHGNENGAAVDDMGVEVAASPEIELAQEALEENRNQQQTPQNVQLRSSRVDHIERMVQHDMLSHALHEQVPLQLIRRPISFNMQPSPEITAEEMEMLGRVMREHRQILENEQNNQERLQQDIEHPQAQPPVGPVNENPLAQVPLAADLDQALPNTTSSSSSSQKSKTV